MNQMITTPALPITKAASKQTYYTIRFLVNRERVDDAYRAYGYFRWVDDTLDAEVATGSERSAFIERQKSLLEKCIRGEMSPDANIQEICWSSWFRAIVERTAVCETTCVT